MFKKRKSARSGDLMREESAVQPILQRQRGR